MFLFRSMHVSGLAGEWCVTVVWLSVRTMMWSLLTCVTDRGAEPVHELFRSHDSLLAIEWESEDMALAKARVLRFATSLELFPQIDYCWTEIKYAVRRYRRGSLDDKSLMTHIVSSWCLLEMSEANAKLQDQSSVFTHVTSSHIGYLNKRRFLNTKYNFFLF